MRQPQKKEEKKHSQRQSRHEKFYKWNSGQTFGFFPGLFSEFEIHETAYNVVMFEKIF